MIIHPIRYIDICCYHYFTGCLCQVEVVNEHVAKCSVRGTHLLRSFIYLFQLFPQCIYQIKLLDN